MEFLEHGHQVTFDSILELLVKFCGKTIWPWYLVMFYLEDCRFNLCLTEPSSQESIFFLSYLIYITCSILFQGEGRLLRFSKEAFIELGDVGFEICLPLNHPIVGIQGEDSLLPMFAVSNHLKVFCVIVS
jgi:hypothetical protein